MDIPMRTSNFFVPVIAGLTRNLLKQGDAETSSA